MKNYLFLFIASVLLSACSSTKTTTTAKEPVTPAGDWEYTISDTPQGDFSGVLTVSRQDNTFSATLNSNGEALPFETFTWDEPTKKVGGEFYYSGMTIVFDGTMSEEEMTGTMSAGGMVFPFKAARKK
jgi:uncharacterized protein YceK